jgi:hypothetical protein
VSASRDVGLDCAQEKKKKEKARACQSGQWSRLRPRKEKRKRKRVSSPVRTFVYNYCTKEEKEKVASKATKIF